MRPTRLPGSKEIKRVVHEYERLRANALGDLNEPPLFTLLVGEGMSVWMRARIDKGPGPHLPSSASSSPLVAVEYEFPSSAEVGAIVADAMLNAAGPAVAQ
jgi:hypothetical protein